MSQFDPHSNRYDLTVLILALAVVASVFIVSVATYNSTQLKADTLLIQQAIEHKADLHEVRCLLRSHIAACDTVSLVSLVRELRVDPRFNPTGAPTIASTPEIQP